MSLWQPDDLSCMKGGSHFTYGRDAAKMPQPFQINSTVIGFVCFAHPGAQRIGIQNGEQFQCGCPPIAKNLPKLTNIYKY